MRVNKRIVHKNPWFSVEKHNLKNNGVYFILKKSPTVFIVTESEDKKIALIKEFRYPIGEYVLQLPAGMVDSGDTLSAAKRELYEETHIKAKKWVKIGEFYVAPGHEDTKIVAYLATDLRGQNNTRLEDNIKSVEWFSINQINGLIEQGKIKCGITLAVLFNYLIKTNYNKK